MEDSEIVRAVKRYVQELYTDSVVSTSHITLRELYRKYNQDEVDALTRKHITLEGVARAART